MPHFNKNYPLILSVKKSLATKLKPEEFMFQGRIHACEEMDEFVIYIPYFEQVVASEQGRVRYGFAENDELVSVQVKFHDEYAHAVYILNESQVEELYGTWRRDFEFICYDWNTGLLSSYDRTTWKMMDNRIKESRNDSFTMYGIEIDENPIHLNKFAIFYEPEGYLKRVVIHNEREHVFFEKLSETDINELKKSILVASEKFIVDKVEKYLKEHGEICMIAIEHFYDGGSADVGVRICLQTEREELAQQYPDDADALENPGDYALYCPLLWEPTVVYQADRLFQYLMRTQNRVHAEWRAGSDETVEMYMASDMVRELAYEMLEILKQRNWSKHALISNDFRVMGPCEYD